MNGFFTCLPHTSGSVNPGDSGDPLPGLNRQTVAQPTPRARAGDAGSLPPLSASLRFPGSRGGSNPAGETRADSLMPPLPTWKGPGSMRSLTGSVPTSPEDADKVPVGNTPLRTRSQLHKTQLQNFNKLFKPVSDAEFRALIDEGKKERRPLRLPADTKDKKDAEEAKSPSRTGAGQSGEATGVVGSLNERRADLGKFGADLWINPKAQPNPGTDKSPPPAGGLTMRELDDWEVVPKHVFSRPVLRDSDLQSISSDNDVNSQARGTSGRQRRASLVPTEAPTKAPTFSQQKPKEFPAIKGDSGKGFRHRALSRNPTDTHMTWLNEDDPGNGDGTIKFSVNPLKAGQAGTEGAQEEKGEKPVRDVGRSWIRKAFSGKR